MRRRRSAWSGGRRCCAMGKTRAIGSPRRRITNSPSVATNLADAAHVHLHTHSGWPVQRGPSILAQCGVTSRLRNQKIGHGLNEQTISQLWGIHQKAKVAEEFQPNGLRASRCPRWRPEPSTTKNPAGFPAGLEKKLGNPAELG